MTTTETARRPRARRELALQPEMRRFCAGNLEVRSGEGSDDGLVEVTGMVVRYGTAYEVNDMFGTFMETIHRGAAAPVLAKNPDIRFLVGHEGIALARTGAEASLEVTDTDEGVMVRAKLDPRMGIANDLIVALERGTITQMSVGMRVDPEGDVWSGEDASGIPNVRDIYRLSDIFDTSAVTYPASTTTTLELAARMAELPAEVTVRTQKLWDLAREGRKGTISQAESDTLMHLIERLNTVRSTEVPAEVADEPVEEIAEVVEDDVELDDEAKADLIERTMVLLAEHRAAPTKEDPVIGKAIATAHGAVGAALAAQMKDPDNGDDPDDKAVWKALSAAHDSLTSAMKAQGVDGTPDNNTDLSDGEGGPDGTLNGSGPVGGAGNEDGTGSRSILIDIDMDMARLRRRPRI